MARIKKETLGFPKGNRNEILSMYNIRYDLDLDIDNAAFRRILSACISCIEQFELHWDNIIEYFI